MISLESQVKSIASFSKCAVEYSNSNGKVKFLIPYCTLSSISLLAQFWRKLGDENFSNECNYEDLYGIGVSCMNVLFNIETDFITILI